MFNYSADMLKSELIKATLENMPKRLKLRK